MRRYTILIFSSLFALGSARALAQPVQCSRIESAIDGEHVELSTREASRIEHFLSHVFPTRAMRRVEHESDRPVTRRVAYSIIEQQGRKFILAAFTGRWKEAANVLAIYRMEADGPNQIWRSNAWEATYYGLHFTTAKLGKRSLVMFEEGTPESQGYSLASVFSFQDAPRGAIIHDLTPTLPRLTALTRFPFRPLYGQAITMRMEGETKPGITLTASDADYEILEMQRVRFTTTWKLNPNRVRFERTSSQNSATLTNMGSRR